MSTTAHPEQRGWMLARLLVLAAIFASGGFLWIASTHELPALCRVLSGLGALLCLAFPARVLYVGARRYHRTGQWSLSAEDRAQWRLRLAARPERPWLLPLVTTILIAVALLNLAGTVAFREDGHRFSWWSALVIAFWSWFLLGQVRSLRKELQQRKLRAGGA